MEQGIREVADMDWSGCEIVEINPRKVSGAPIVKGTRVQADEISENFGVPVGVVLELLEFAGCKQVQPQR
jgi:hypothetical protein